MGVGMKHAATVHAIWWWDIVGVADWGGGMKQPSLCVTVGVILEKPSTNHKIPVYRIYDSLSSDSPGGSTTIPKVNVKCVKKVGTVELPWPLVKLGG